MRKAGEINERNTRFWKAQKWLMERRLAVPEIAAAAYALVQDDGRRGIPVAHQRTYEVALRDAAVAVRAAAKVAKVKRARRAGVSKKGDALTKMLREIVARNIKITVPQVVMELKAHETIRKGVIEVTDDEITIESRSGRRKTQSLTVPISGLKDRLSRIKKEFRVAKSR